MNGPQKDRQPQYITFGIPIGAGAGVALGLVLMTMLDHSGFFAVGIAVGLSLGTTIGLALDLRKE